MIQKLIPYIIWTQILVWLFYVWIGLEEWQNLGIYDNQTLYLFALSLWTLAVYIRLIQTPLETRSFKIIFEHAVLIGMISWLFYTPWWNGWEVFWVIFISANLGIVLLLTILETQLQKNFWWGNWNIPEYFWKIWWLLTLINSITLPLIFVLLHESLSIIWVFYGINWVFLWKEDFSDSTL